MGDYNRILLLFRKTRDSATGSAHKRTRSTGHALYKPTEIICLYRPGLSWLFNYELIVNKQWYYHFILDLMVIPCYYAFVSGNTIEIWQSGKAYKPEERKYYENL